MSKDRKITLEINASSANSDNIDIKQDPFESRQRLSRSPPLTPIPAAHQRKLSSSSLPELLSLQRRVTRSQTQLFKELHKNTEDKSNSEDSDGEDVNLGEHEKTIVEKQASTILDHEEKKEESKRDEKEKNKEVTCNPEKSNTRKIMDTSIMDAMAANKKPAIPTFICPQTFHPSKGSANNFIDNYERTAIANGWDNTLKIAYFGSFLEGGANLWYKLYIADPANAQKGWAHVVEDFSLEFNDPDRRESLLARVENRKQGPSELVKDYFYELKTVYYDYDPTLDSQEFIKFFKKGLTQEAAYHYHWLTHPPNRPPTSLEEIKELATTIDKAPRQTQSTPMEQFPHRQAGPSGNFHQGYRYQPNNRQNFSKNSSQQNKGYFGQKGQQRPQGYRQNDNFNNTGRYQQHFAQSSRQQNSRQQYGTSNNREFVRTSYQNTNRENSKWNHNQQRDNLPVTRTMDNRPKCYNCNKPGHFAASCQFRGNHPNAKGRQN